jgi:Uma2 family endonuclease
MAAIALLAPPAGRNTVSWEQFVAMDEAQGWEWVAGHLVEAEEVRSVHSNLLVWLYSLFFLVGQDQGLGRVFSEAMLVRLTRSGTGRFPDLSFLLSANQDRLKSEYIEGAVDLAIEVISPSSYRRDYVQKREEYEREGVTEYWIIDPELKEATFLRLDGLGRYVEIESDAEGRVGSVVLPDLRLLPSDLWADPKPSPLSYLPDVE